MSRALDASNLEAKSALADQIMDPLELEGWIWASRILGHDEIAAIGVRRLAEVRRQAQKRGSR